MSALTKHALRVYVALSNLGDKHGDVLDALIPFFDPILAQLDNALFDPSVFAAGVRRLYSWRFTSDVAREFIPKLAQKGFLERIGRTTGYVVRYTPPGNLEGAAPEALRIIGEILDVFESFPARLTDLFHFSRSREELEDILIRFLVSLNAYDTDFFKVQVAKLGNEQFDATPRNGLAEGGRQLSVEERYLCARFLQEMSTSHAEFTPYLVRLASIGLLTEVVEDFVKPTSVADASDLVIFLDAPMALHYLGLSGKNIQFDVKNVLDSLRNIGCKLMMFPESCEEMSRNLSSMLARQAPAREGYTHEAMRRGEVEESYVIAVKNNPEKAMESVGIPTRNFNLAMFPNTHLHFAREYYEDFLSTITWVKDIEPREHDAKCAAYIMRLREGRQSQDLFRCRFAFATNNPKFAREARSYCLGSHLITERQWGPVVHLVDLATLAWLRTGLHQSEIIPRGRLVSTCERILQLHPEVTHAVYEKLSQVTPERIAEYEILLSDQRSVRTLMDQTVGDYSTVTTDNVTHLFEQMRLATVREVTDQFNIRLEEQSRRHREEAAALESERIAQEKARDAEMVFRAERDRLARERVQAAHDALEDQNRRLAESIAGVHLEELARLDSVLLENNRTIGFVSNTFLVLLMLAVILSVIGAAFSFFDSVSHNPGIIVATLIVGLLSGYSLWAALMNKPINVVGFTLDALGKRLLITRAEKRVSSQCLTDELRNIRFSNGIGKRITS